MRVGVVAGILTIAMAGAAPASACSLIPIMVLEPEGLSPEELAAWRKTYEEESRLAQEQWWISEQARLWGEADSVMLMKVEYKGWEKREVTSRRGTQERDFRVVELAPVRWLKGDGNSAPLRLSYEYDWCSGTPDWDVLYAGLGHEQLVYFSGAPSQETLMTTVAVDRITHPGTQAAMAAQ